MTCAPLSLTWCFIRSSKPLMPVAPNQTEVVVNLKVDAKAAPAAAPLMLTATATVGGQAYNHPPVNVTATLKK